MYTGTDLNAKQYYHTDHQGSSIAMSSSSGGLLDQYSYSAYGEPGAEGLTGNPFRFTGRRLDAETGLYYYRARFYSPVLGRFLQTDPIGYGDNMNMYAYVDNDPMTYKDYSGLRKYKAGINIKANVVTGGRFAASISIDTETLEINVTLGAGVRVGVSGRLNVFATVSDSEKLGNQVTGSVKAVAEVGVGPISTGAEAGIEGSTREGVKIIEPHVTDPEAGGEVNGNGLKIDAKAGVDAGIDIDGSINVSIPDTTNKITEYANDVKQRIDDAKRSVQCAVTGNNRDSCNR